MKPKLIQGTTITLLLLAMLVTAVSPKVMAHTEADPFVTDLIAGQHLDVGDVRVWNDGTYLYVEYVTVGSWYLTETHLHVATSLADIPQKNGNPPPGQFDYSMDHGPFTDDYTYAIDLGDWDPDTLLYIAAHAGVCGPGDGEPLPAQGVLATMPLREYPNGQLRGTITVVIDGDNLVVTFETMNGWKMLDTYLYLGTVVPIAHEWWNFPYKHEGLAEVTNDTYIVPLADVGVDCGDTLYISAMTWAVFRNDLGEWYKFVWSEDDPADPWIKYFSVEIVCERVCETAWADGFDFPGSNWAMYFTYTVQ